MCVCVCVCISYYLLLLFLSFFFKTDKWYAISTIFKGLS